VEFFLNFLWVLIALAGLGAWRGFWVHQVSGARKTPFHQWTAFACALIFLFFAVSLTDDLHSGLILFDEATSGRRHSAVYDCLHPSAQHSTASPTLGAAGPSVTSSDSPLHAVARVTPHGTFVRTSPERVITLGRAPPVSYL